MLLMLDSAEELALEGFVRGNRSTESFGRVGKRVFAETSEDSVVGWGFPEGVGGFLGEDLSVAEDPASKEVSTEDTTGEAAEEASTGYSSEPGGWGEVFSQFRKDSGVVEETPGVSGMEFEDVEEVEDEDESEDTEDEEEEFEDESEDTEDEDVFEDIEEVEDEDESEEVEEVEDEDEFEDAEEDDPTEVVEFSLDDTSSGGEEEEVEEGSTDEYSVEEEQAGYSGGLEFEDVEEVDDDEDTADVEDADEDTTEEEDANTPPSSVEVVSTPKSREVTPEEVSKPKKPAHKPRKRLSRQDAPSTSQEPHPTIREAKPKSQKGRLKKPSTNTHTFDTPKRSPGIRRLEPIPATVREYVMANPDVCYNDVVKLYSLKQIKKELALGRIYRSGNKLGV